MSLLDALARSARPPVFCLVGDGGRRRARALRLDGRLRVVDSPRHATVLVIAGELPTALHEAARRVHDQLSTPRGVVVWNREGDQPPFASAVSVGDAEEPGAAVLQLHRDLLTGRRASTPMLGRPENPVEWKGVGPHGQGGKGMMGGVPYGRAMAMTGDDLRDGLQLDRVAVTVGPFLPWMPPGMRLSVDLQGDVIQCLTPRVPPLRHRDVPEVFSRASSEEVRVADLEVARARHHLETTADLLFSLGLQALAVRTLQLAAELTPSSAEDLRALERALCWMGALRFATQGIGHLPSAGLAGGGPVARAAGLDEDARQGDPAYRDLGFRVLSMKQGDARARWRQRLAEAAQALELARRAGDRRREPGPVLEGPRGPLGGESEDSWLAVLSELAPGQAWDTFVTTLVSLDLDPASLPASGDDEEGSECPT